MKTVNPKTSLLLTLESLFLNFLNELNDNGIPFVIWELCFLILMIKKKINEKKN